MERYASLQGFASIKPLENRFVDCVSHISSVWECISKSKEIIGQSRFREQSKLNHAAYMHLDDAYRAYMETEDPHLNDFSRQRVWDVAYELTKHLGWPVLARIIQQHKELSPKPLKTT